MALLSIVNKIARVRFILSMMKGNPYFPSPTPPLATVEVASDTLEEASIAARGSGPDATAVMRLKEEELVVLVKHLAAYVESVANTHGEEAEAIILSSGFEVRRRAMRITADITARATNVPGEINVYHKAVLRSTHEVQLSLDPTDEKNWYTVYRGTRGRVVLTGNAPGRWYYIRARVVTKDGTSPWSEVVSVYLIF